MRARIYSVTDIKLAQTKSKPPKLVIHAQGLVTSSGWTQPELSPWVYIAPPKDGIMDLDFTAEQPHGIVLPVILPISATLVLSIPTWVTGVRIHASTNTEVAMLNRAEAASEGDEVPFPWFVTPA